MKVGDRKAILVERCGNVIEGFAEGPQCYVELAIPLTGQLQRGIWVHSDRKFMHGEVRVLELTKIGPSGSLTFKDVTEARESEDVE